MEKYRHTKNFKKCTEKASKTDGQTDVQMNRTDFIGPLPQSSTLSQVFLKFKNKIWK